MSVCCANSLFYSKFAFNITPGRKLCTFSTSLAMDTPPNNSELQHQVFLGLQYGTLGFKPREVSEKGSQADCESEMYLFKLRRPHS